MEKMGDNPLVSTLSSTSGLQVVLHPLVLLSVSDYITRHTMREQEGPVVCGLLGQTHGREITIEHAFDCQLYTNDSGEHILHEDWFSSRLEQMKQVHTDRELDLVGWSTILPQSGPEPSILPLHSQILSKFNESSVLLAFHPELISSHSGGGKLPLTIYESHYEVEGPGSSSHAPASQDGEDSKMKDSSDTAAQAGGGAIKIKFSELPYSVEMGDAEVISMDTVARTATAASAAVEKPAPGLNSESSSKSASGAKAVVVDAKGKKRIVTSSEATVGSGRPILGGAGASVEASLSREEEEMLASLTTKANAVKMLHSRIRVLLAYLDELPPDFVSGDKAGVITEEMKSQAPGSDGSEGTIPDYTILRSIQALVNRLPLVVPSDDAAFDEEVQSETNDVKLIGLLREVIDQTAVARNVGRKSAIVDSSRGRGRGALDFSSNAGSSGGFTSQAAGDLMGMQT